MTAAIPFDDVGRERGAPPLVLLHGFPHDRTLWSAVVPALGRATRVIAPDLRGLGHAPVEGPYSMDRYADDVISILDARKVERAVIGGLSMGGYVAFALWRRHPGRVAGLVLADTRAGADAGAGRANRDRLVALARVKGTPVVAEAMLENMVGPSTRRERPAVVETMRAMMRRAPVEGVIGALEAMRDRPDSTATLATITVPTLVVCGEEDALTPPEQSRAMHEAIAGSRLALIPRAGHVPCVERPEEFAAAVTGFLETL